MADLVATGAESGSESGAESGVCLMFDDPFGHTDRHRRSLMLDILTAEAGRQGHQILLFTCRPEDFAGIENHVSLSEPPTPSD